MSDGIPEIVYTLGRLQSELEDTAVGGLRASGADRLPALDAIRADLDAVGAASLASRLSRLTEAIRAGERDAGAALMRVQASLRLLDRLLTLEVATARLSALAGERRGEGA